MHFVHRIMDEENHVGEFCLSNYFIIEFPEFFNLEPYDFESVHFLDNNICGFVIRNNFSNYPLFTINEYIKNKQRILITPGIVELGDKQYELNKEFGKHAASGCDFAILVGEKQANPIKDGLKEVKFSEENIYVAKNLDDALNKMNELINKDTVVLLENDLPDNYL